MAGSERGLTMALTAARLRAVHTLDDVLKLLSDELDWPIGTIDLDDAAFDYKPQELGIPAEQMPRLQSIRQLRPLTTHQPWGIFFLDFSGPRLPITPLRRLLQSLVTSRRSSPKHHPTWALPDLLFVITTDSADSVELHLVAFSESEGHVPEIRSLPWRPEHSPQQYLTRLANELLPLLEWPEDPDDAAGWRLSWRSAFKLRHGEAIRSAEHLAERMATVAKALRVAVRETMANETRMGPFHKLLEEVRQELVADVAADRFADMCAQTLTYGTLSARVTDPIGFGATPTLAVVPLANPFLAAFFEQVHDQVASLDIQQSDLEQLVADLRATNIEAILDQFGSTAKGGDPVVHFYEEFLKRYDSRMRADAGAFYTPQPVVYFMVRAIDDLIRTYFGLVDGIADSSSWRQVAEKCQFSVPAGVSGEERFLSMIDPATGTGTYLVEWIRRARNSFLQNHPHDEWPDHLRNVIIPSLHAFELMLAPYAIAHLKVALEVQSQGGGDAPVAIYLTDTLEYPALHSQLPTMTDPVASEGERAAELKQHSRFSICIGNPPYDREQRSTGDHGKRKGGVVRFGVPGINPLLGAFLDPLKKSGLSAYHARSLYNDYIYFWRWATWITTEREPRPGIVAFITASSYLDGVSFGGVREHFRKHFHELSIVDLGGDGMGVQNEVDENVFDIRVPVAICLAVRSGDHDPASCTVRYTRLAGTRIEKFAALKELEIGSIDWTTIPGSGADPFKPASRLDSDWASLSDLMPWSARGVQFSRTWPVAPSRSVAQRRWDTLLDTPKKRRADLLHESRDARSDTWYTSFLGKGDLAPIESLRAGDRPDAVREINYRTFDRHWCVADRRVIDMPRPALWRAQADNQVFLISLAGPQFSEGPQAVATTLVPDLNSFNNRGGVAHPLWRSSVHLEPNITAGLLGALSLRLGVNIAAEHFLAYVYGILGTGALSEYQARAQIPLTSPPMVPITASSELFERVERLGRELLWWHTFGERFAPKGASSLPLGGTRQIEPIRGYPDSFSYDADKRQLRVGTGVFGPVSRDAWTFQVSGFKVLMSWLGYRMANRKGRKSSSLDDIRPERWTFSEELIRVISIIERTLELTPRATELLAAVTAGALIDPATLPIPADSERKAPS